MTAARAHVALVHYPVRDREGATVTTAVTTLDVHDLARSARTFGLGGVWIVTPVTAQRTVVASLLARWEPGGAGARRTPERTEALALVRVVASLDDAIAALGTEHGVPPRVVVTSARDEGGRVHDYATERAAIAAAAGATLVVFGTGHGLVAPWIARADARLPPIAPGRYNHLSVRAAAAITLDRLFGDS